MITEEKRIKKTQKSNVYLMMLILCIIILSVRSNIISTVQSESQLDTIESKELTIQQLTDHIDLVSFKLNQAEKSIVMLQDDLIILKNVLNNKKNRRNFIAIDSLSIIRGANGEIIKIGD